MLTREDLATLLQLSLTQVDAYRRLGSHPAIRKLDGPGHPRFSGQAVADWLAGGRLAPVSRNKFFAAARRRMSEAS